MASVLLGSGQVAAQAEFAVDRFQPSAPGDRFMLSPDPAVHRGVPSQDAELGDDIPGDTWLLSSRLMGAYESQPLQLDAATPGAEDTVIDDRVWLYGQAAISLFGLIQADAMLPFALVNTGATVTSQEGSFQAPSGSALGDARLGGRATVLRQKGYWPGVGMDGWMWLPTGSAAAYTSTEEGRYGATLTLGADLDDFSYRLSGGRRRQSLRFDPGFLLASDTTVTSAFGWHIKGFTVGPEVLLLVESNEQRHQSNSDVTLEALLGASYDWDRIRVQGGAAHGVVQVPGTADFRLFLSVEFHSHAIERGERRELLMPQPTPNRAEVRHTFERATFGASATQASTTQSSSTQSPAVQKPATQTPGSSGLSAADLDGDTLPDAIDDCPKEFGTGAVRGKMGCPLDGDADGVLDHDDACPKEAGLPDADATKNGCAPQLKVSGTQIELAGRIEFQTGEDELSSGASQILDAVANVLVQQPEIVRIAIEGHTDDVGAEETNLELSRRRAVAVARWLIEHGVDQRRIEVHGYGPRRPKVPNDSDEARATNRRVEFTITKRDPRGEAAWTEGPVASESKDAEAAK